MRILPLIIVSAALFMSCDNKKATTEETQNISPVPSDSLVVGDSLTINTSAENGVENASAGVRPALNPEHGQPYHRCDIQVGAPIDSAPDQPAAQAMPQGNVGAGFNTSPIAPQAATSAPLQASGPKPAFNPEHGQPYHQCELQVGAPLT